MVAPYTGTFTRIAEADIGPLVILLQAHTPLEQLSNMEARTVFEFMHQRGYSIIKADA